MSHDLQALRRPSTVALIGASAEFGSVGQVVLDNVLAGGFAGTVYAVNPRPVDRPGVTWATSVDALPEAPDLAVLMTPPATIPGIIDDLGRIGTRAAVIVSAGLTRANGLREAMLAAARRYDLRIVGPNCIGLMLPAIGLNASFAGLTPPVGRIALISQSGALVTAILDWAIARGLGFSGIVSVGDMADVDMGDLISLFADDEGTDAILLYVEGISDAAKFMAVARACTRRKPIVAIKAGRSAAAARAAFSHTGALAGAYDVYRAAFDRAGILAVDTLTELFDAAAVLATLPPPSGDRIAIVSNGGGAGILAVDAMTGRDGRLAELSDETVARLNDALPATWSHGNPVDVVGDGGSDRYCAALDAVLADDGVDGVLVMYCPTAVTAPAEIAAAVAGCARGQPKPVLACWLGEATAAAARPVFREAGIPLFTTPHEAVHGFGYLHMARAAAAAPTEYPTTPSRGRDEAQAVVAQVRADGRAALTEIEAQRLLAAYGIPVIPTRLARTPEEVAAVCAALAPPYAVKIVSPAITHKSDVGGVVLNLDDAAAATEAARDMAVRIAQARPDASITGFAIETMCVRPGAVELIAGIADDATFGRVLMVGAGGKAVEVLADRALELTPVDMPLARAMIARTRVARLLRGYRDVPPADVEAVAETLVRLSAMVTDIPDLAELDINPLLVDASGVIALDARILLRPGAGGAGALHPATARSAS